MTMTNKQYKIAREEAESADELYTFEKYNGWRTTRHLDSDDLKEIRADYKNTKKELNAFSLEGFGGRALIIPTDSGYILKSYYTEVAEIRDGEFLKLWGGFSVTTLKHINIFRSFANMSTLSKREWIELEVA